MWRISHETRVLILSCLVNGMSMRGTARVAGVAVNTVARLVREIGVLADRHHEQNVVGVDSRRIQIDELWGFVGAKQKNAPNTKKRYPGDIWAWLAVDPDSKLVVSYIVGNRTSREAHALITDVRKRVIGSPHFTSDGLQQYEEAICAVYGNRHPYSRIVHSERSAVLGEPDLGDAGTALVERFNLTVRAHNARYVRRGMTYSKSIEQHVNMLCLSLLHYNWVAVHSTLKTTPAVAAGLIRHQWSIHWIAELAEMYHETARDVARRAAARRATDEAAG